MSVRVLHLSAAPPDPDALGGVSVHVAALATNAPASVTMHTAHPSGAALEVARWAPRGLAALLPLSTPGARSEESLEAALVAALVGTRADVLHVHSPQLGPRAIARAARRASVPIALTLHDHALVCENHELIEHGARFCGVPLDPARCDRCLAGAQGRPAGSVQELRSRMGELVRAASVVVAPSASVLGLVARVHPGVSAKATRLAWGVPLPRVRCTRPASAPGPLRVAVVGVFARVKGSEQLPALFAACADLDVEWHLFGATDGASQREVTRSAPRVVVHGAYRRAALAPRLERAGCQLALLPSIGAESFSLALSEIVAAGLPVVASDLGALGERVREGGLGWTFDPWAPGTLHDVLRTLTGDRVAIDAAARRVRALPHRTEADMVRDHAAVWADVAATHATMHAARPAATTSDETAALAAYREGERAAAARRPSRAERLVSALRKTDFYRDLSLRRLLSEQTRRSVEESMAAFFRSKR
jgi:glycosyltransferase involved in cell wall biosynthesis